MNEELSGGNRGASNLQMANNSKSKGVMGTEEIMRNIGGKYFNLEETIHVDALEEELEENLTVNSKPCRTKLGTAIGPPVVAQSDLSPSISCGLNSEIIEEDGSIFVVHGNNYVVGSLNESLVGVVIQAHRLQ
uniref:Uncharacterized protein n=1 Tax=Cannabis sativa TaxID=3483 RepID=A0A803Q7E9_CANSA